jgi:hypothetical protein
MPPPRPDTYASPYASPYSSYKAYISAQGEGLVTRLTILGMFKKKESDASKRYQAFVESALGIEVESPLGKVYAGMILGSESFKKDILKKIQEGQLEKENVSYRKALRAPVGAEAVLSEVCGHYGLTKDELISGGQGEAKKICTYLMKKHTVATTREIGVLLGNMSYAATSKMYQRFAKDLPEDEQLKREVEGLRKKLSGVEG